jgi:hypothetical protein
VSRRREADIEAVLTALSREPGGRLVAMEDGGYAVSPQAGQRATTVSSHLAGRLAADGLLHDAGGGAFAVSTAGRSWLKRRLAADLPFQAQHHAIRRVGGSSGRDVLANLDESPVATLVRRNGKSGKAWLPSHAAVAAERLRRDFEIGRMQPRVTANWSASVSDGRRSGDNSGLAGLTDMALGARLRFGRAVQDVGPELSGVLVDVCCFLKGLEAVERERQWPARSAKLVLRLALERLARHYGLLSEATGKPASGRLRHWGADGFRPEIA